MKFLLMLLGLQPQVEYPISILLVPCMILYSILLELANIVDLFQGFSVFFSCRDIISTH